MTPGVHFYSQDAEDVRFRIPPAGQGLNLNMTLYMSVNRSLRATASQSNRPSGKKLSNHTCARDFDPVTIKQFHETKAG